MVSVELNEEEGQYRSNLVRNWPATHELNPFVSQRETGRASWKEATGKKETDEEETPKKELESSCDFVSIRVLLSFRAPESSSFFFLFLLFFFSSTNHRHDLHKSTLPRSLEN